MLTIKIFQTFFRDKHRSSLDPSFTPYDISDNPAHHLREPPLYYRLYEENKHRESDYTGLVSYKFNLKSKLSGARVLSFINQNPGYDVYFVNPYPQLAYLSYNIWEQGEYFHPGIKNLTDKLLLACNYKFNTNTHGRDTRDHLLYANYWIGNETFWDRYIPFLLTLHECTSVAIDSSNNPYLEQTSYMTPTVMYPFIFERMFTTFIKNQTDLKYLAYPHTNEEIINCCNSAAELVMYKNIRHVIDDWDNKGRYNEEEKAIFKSVTGAYAEYELLTRKIGTHPFI